MDEPLASDAAKRLIREILKSGRFTYSKHAKEEMLADDLTTIDCENVLRDDVARPGEYEHAGRRPMAIPRRARYAMWRDGTTFEPRCREESTAEVVRG